MNITDALKFKFPDIDFVNEVRVQDDGKGPYIAEWKRKDPLPSNIDLIEWEQQSIEIKEINKVNIPIFEKLKEIDAKSIRALRSNDTERLVQLEAQAVELRNNLVK